MKAHTILYFKYFGYDISNFVPCEVCGQRAQDIHHIEPRGMGGTKKPDTIENLMALCREHHLAFGDRKQHMEFLKETHLKFIENKI